MPTKKSIETFECSICCSDDLPIFIRNKPNRIICPGCSTIFCIECQKNYSRGDCMNCHMEFKQNFILEYLGKSFIENVIKPKIIEELMKEQKELLKFVQPIVDWEREVRKQKKNARFGIPISIPERPKLSKINTNQVFPCPTKECRGFVESGICGLCKKSICMKCRELLEINHICSPDTLMSISTLAIDTKPCPKCCAGIHRTEGCNHMFCTNCRTHFDWVTGKILQNSSNGHYINLQRFAQNVATRDVELIAEKECDNTTANFSIHRHKVALEEIDRQLIPNELIHCLWIDSSAIRLAKKKLYNDENIELQNIETLQELQVKYLLNDIDEKNWSRNVYMNYRKLTLNKLYSQIFNIYLEVTDSLQVVLRDEPKQISRVIDEYRKLIELCNDSFKSIQDEYGGSLHKFRSFDDDLLSASFI